MPPIVAAPPDQLADLFRQLADRWRDETRFLSSTTEIVLNPAYQRIIGLGPGVIPLILSALAREPEHWFWALRALTGENPAPAEARGRAQVMAEAWLRWGRENGYHAEPGAALDPARDRGEEGARMDETTRYRTTDLYLYSDDDLAALAAALQARLPARCVGVNRLTHPEAWYCNFSIDGGPGGPAEEPEPGIAAVLAVIEALDPPLRSAWARCSQRVFDVGYDFGRGPFAFRQELSAETLGRLAAVGASLRVTLYSDPGTGPAEPGA